MAELLEKLLDRFMEDPGELERRAFDAVSVNRDDVHSEMFRQSGTYTHWAILVSIADTRYRRYKRHVENQLWPSAAQEARRRLETEGIRATSAAVEEIGLQNAAYQAGLETLSTYGAVLDIIKKVENGLYQKRDMLKALSFRVGREESVENTEYAEKTYDVTKPEEVFSSPAPKPHLTTEDLEEKARSVLRRNKNGKS